MGRLGSFAAVVVWLCCAPAASAREVQAEQVVAGAASHLKEVRVQGNLPRTFKLSVRPYSSIDVRIRSTGCRAAPVVLAATERSARRLAVRRGWQWLPVDSQGPAGLLELTIRVVTRSKRCAVLVDALRAHERIELGAAMWTRYLGADPRYERTAEQFFSSVTPENDMKMMFLQPQRGRFEFAVADRLVEWARSRGKAVHGHALIYGEQLPGWLHERDIFGRSVFTRDEMLQILQTHVKKVVRHFKGRVASWDVVNEAFRTDGSLRPNLFLEVIGPDYIEHAFRWAHEADPEAQLFYNDAGAELDNAMSDALVGALRDMRRRGVPIDGIGFQAHLDIGAPPGQGALAANLARFADLGLDVAISELDVSTEARGFQGDPDAAQAQIYADVAAVCAAEPRCTRITVWGVGDAVSWRGEKRSPLPFDTEYRTKRAWHAMTASLGSQP